MKLYLMRKKAQMKKKSNDIINKNDRQQLDMIISGEIEDIDTFKSGDNYKNK